MDNLTQNFLDRLRDDVKSSTAPTTAKLPGDTENYNYSWFEQPEVKNQGNLWQGAGAALWHFADTAAFGLPGVLMPEDIKEQLGVIPGVGTPWDQLDTWGKVGAVVGEAAGFLVPMSWIGKASKYVMAGTKAGGRTMAKSAVTKGVDVYGEIPNYYSNIESWKSEIKKMSSEQFIKLQQRHTQIGNIIKNEVRKKI